MMICAADFEELFPWMAESDRARDPAPAPGRACIARWEGDGGRTLEMKSGPAPALPRSAFGRYRRPDPLFSTILFSSLPAVAVYGAAMAVLATSGKLLEG